MKIRFTPLLLTILIAAGCSKKAPTASNEPAKPATPATTQPVTAPKAEFIKAAAPAATQVAPSVAKPAEDKSKPRLDYSPKPIFPSALAERCIEGEVRVKMRVTKEGKAEEIQIVDSTDNAFSNALLTVLPLWRFFPAEKDGLPVARTVNIAIPFVINDRPSGLPNNVDRGQAELIGLVRPAHTGKGPAKALVRINLTSDTIVSGVEIAKREGNLNDKAIIDAVSQWVFMPSESEKTAAPQSTVEAEITFTESGNVLVQYPFPAPQPTK